MRPFFRQQRAALLWAALLVSAKAATGVELSMPDTTFRVPDTLRIPLLADSISPADSVFAYQFVLTFDSAVLAGVGATSAGTISEPFGDPFTSGGEIPGQLRVAAAGIHPIAGSGPFVMVLLRSVRDTDAVSNVRFDSVLLNEGDPPVTYDDPLATITVRGRTDVGPSRQAASALRITISPNPARDFLTIYVPSRGRWHARLWNLLGRELALIEGIEPTMSLSLSHLPGGVYFVTLDERPRWSQKIFLIR